MGLFDNLGGEQTQTEQQQAPVTPPAGNDAPVTPPADVPAESAQAQIPNTPPADVPAASAADQDEINFNATLDKMSGGVIKDKASFEAFLPKLTEYETLKQQNEDYAAKMAHAPVFVDDEVRILNELKAAGASKEQIKTFQKINEYGNIGEMPDRDARIAKMVMIDGVKPSVAELKVDREFKLNDDSLSEEERMIADDDLRVAADNDRKALEKFKTAASQANNLPAEEVLIQQQAALQAHQSKIKPYVADVMAVVPNLGTFNLSGEDGDKAVNFEIPLDASTKAQLGQYVENYFMDGLTPVTPESTREALNYARAEYFRENIDKELKRVYQLGVSKTTEALTAKYENRSGLKPPADNPVINGGNNEAATGNFMQRVANRNV